MKKMSIILGIVTVALIAGAWLFFTYGGSKQQPLSESEQQVLAVQDKRLTKGDESAPVKIVEYADILCPYCAKANEEIIPQVQSNYIDKNQAHYEVRLVAMISPDLQRAGEGAYCAAEQNKFWDYLDTAYKDTWDNYYSQNKTPQDVDLFTERNIFSFASRVGLDTLLWQQCMDSGKYEKTITANQEKMSEIKAYGTPHFIINGNNYNGAPPFSSFKAVIDAELNKSKASE
ncbi:thioredoxin domain-containing protein [Candidatus Saccharibacteria bacterium]|nr:thioredoxin domain-containing protein [Candidatus Saccharibacteria bacterium]